MPGLAEVDGKYLNTDNHVIKKEALSINNPPLAFLSFLWCKLWFREGGLT